MSSPAKAAQDLLTSIKHNSLGELRFCLANNPNLSIDEVRDRKSATVLHQVSNNDNTDMLELLLRHYDKLTAADPVTYTADRKKTWLNHKDAEGFSCLHYAVFKANWKSAQLLEEHGSDIYQVNSLGLSVMHIAAQGDSPFLLVQIEYYRKYYYMSKGFKIQVEDGKGSTPLHWACYSGRESSVNALIAWGAYLNCQDKIYGLTPLHLAVLSGNGRVVKKLLLRGADRDVKDFRNKYALDLAKDNEYSNITSMIEDKIGCAEFYNLKQPFRKTKSSWSLPFIIFIVFYISSFLLNLIFVAEHMDVVMNIVYIVLTATPIIFVVLAGCNDPGYLKSDKQSAEELFRIMAKYDPVNICFDCEIIKPLRSRHCYVCQSCVMVYDHHCPWINNCIGAKNYMWFFMFIMTMYVDLLFTLAYYIFNLVSKIDWSSNATWVIIHIIVVIYTMGLSLFAIPLMILIYVQVNNCIMNKTTLYRFNSHQEEDAKKPGNGTKPSRTTSEVNLLESSNVENHVQDDKQRNDTAELERLRGSSDLSRPLVLKAPKMSGSIFSNCMDMCIRNKSNLAYRIGA